MKASQIRDEIGGLRKHIATFDDNVDSKLARIINASNTRMQVLASKAELQTHTDNIRMITDAAHTQVRDAIKELRERALQSDSKVDVLAAMLQQKADDLDQKIESNNFVLYCK